MDWQLAKLPDLKDCDHWHKPIWRPVAYPKGQYCKIFIADLGDGVLILPLCLTLVRHIWVLCPVLGELVILKWIQRKIMTLIKGFEHSSHEERLREMGLFSLDKRKLSGILFMWINTWWGNYEDGAKLFSVAPSNRTRVNEHKLKCSKFHWIKNNNNNMRVVKYWSGLHRDIVETKSWLDMVLTHHVYLPPLWTADWARPSLEATSNLSHDVMLWYWVT